MVIFFSRCMKWIVNVRRDDLNLSNVKHKYLCSTHFETRAYVCPTDIAQSSLVEGAFPTLFQCPNPPPSLTPKRPPPRERSTLPPPKKRKKSLFDFCDTSPDQDQLNEDPEPGTQNLETTDSSTSLLVPSSSAFSKLQEELDSVKGKLAQTQKDFTTFRSAHYLKMRKMDRLQERLKTKEKIELELRQELEVLRQKKIDSYLEKMPPVPAALFRIMARAKKVMNWKKEQAVIELSLSVFFKSSAAYDVLRDSGFLLPHPSTLRKQCRTVLSQTGLCPKLLDMARIRCLTLSEEEKYVTLSLDGMSLTKGLTYNKHDDSLIGLVDCASYHQSNNTADHGVVFMIRSLTHKWKQVIGYVICSHNLSGSALDAMTKDAIASVESIGLRVKAIIMDQEATHMKWLKDSAVTPDRPFITLENNSKVYCMPDPPHLVKNLRNNFMDKDIEYELNGKRGVAKWDHVVMLYRLDASSRQSVRAVPKWTDEHINPSNAKKMKVIWNYMPFFPISCFSFYFSFSQVSLAVQIFSHSASTAMQLYVEQNHLPPDAIETAEFLAAVNKLWDYVNSCSVEAPPGKKAVTAKTLTADLARFDDFMDFINSLKFYRKEKPNAKRRINTSIPVDNIPSHKGWKITLNAMKSLCSELLNQDQTHPLSYICMRKCNQDHVENLHGQIRAYHGFNDHPNVISYVTALKYLSCQFLTAELLKPSSGANCLPDNDLLATHPSVPQSSAECSAPQDLVSPEANAEEGNADSWLDNEMGEFNEQEQQLSALQCNIVAYISGSVVKSLTKKDLISCPECLNLVLSSTQLSSHRLTELKDFKEGALTRISQPVEELLCHFEDFFQQQTSEAMIRNKPQRTLVQSFLTKYPSFNNSLNCRQDHGVSLVHDLLKKYAICRIFYYVKLFNRELKGRKKSSDLNKIRKLL